MKVLLVFILVRLSICRGFYLPNVSPTEYSGGNSIPIRAVKLWSPNTQVPYEYYTLPFCKPNGGEVSYDTVNFGEILRGESAVSTAYNITMLTNLSCKTACSYSSLESNNIDNFISLIRNEYSVHLDVDALPISVEIHSRSEPQYELGFKIGFMENNKVYLNNHLIFHLKYHQINNHFRVVGATVEPLSIDNEDLKVIKNDICEIKYPSTTFKLLEKGTPTAVTFTYEVKWTKSDVEWASRWDIYLSTGEGQIHWLSIINSIIMVIFLTAIMTIILLKTLRRDIALYNKEDETEDIIEESGWKLVHGDVFRPPRRSALLSVFIGSGIQLLCMIFIVLFFAMLGMLSPASRGALLTAVIMTYVFMGALAGYFAGRMYKTMRGFHWKSTAIMTGVLYPSITLGSGFVINFFLWIKGSSASLPFTTILGILSLWLLVSLPLVFIGFFFGFRKRAYDQPVRTNQIPRAIPDRKMHQGLMTTTLLCGLLPFGSLFIELFFIFNAIWNRQFYYLFGFLFIVFIIVLISCAQVAIVATYFQLCSEDYHWWWRSFISSGGAALYVFFYSVYYFITKLSITNFVSILLYFGYCSIMVISFWILTGTIGFLAAFTFLRRIYAAIKID